VVLVLQFNTIQAASLGQAALWQFNPMFAIQFMPTIGIKSEV
jgi:hypothetical protein